MATAEMLDLPPAPVVPRPRTLVVGTALGCAAVAGFFAALISIYVGQRQQTLGAGETWIPSGTIELTPGVFMWFTSLLSIVWMQWAIYAIARDIRKHAFVALSLVAIFGISMINQTAYYFVDMDFPVDTNAASTLLYTIVGSHMVLMIVVVVAAVFVGLRTLAGNYSSRNTDGLVSVALIWYLMVAIYTAIWYIIYVTK